MKFRVTTAALAAFSLVPFATASPVRSTKQSTRLSDSGSVIVHEEFMTINGFTGVYQVLLNESLPEITPDQDLVKRCGSNQVNCDYTGNRAVTGICDLLMDALSFDRHNTAAHTTSICFTADTSTGKSKCCVSWQRKIQGLVKEHLLNAANAALQCDRDGLVSAWVGDVSLLGACQSQCLSTAETC